MAILLTESEKSLISEGKLDPSSILEHRKIHPVQPVNLNEVDSVKEEIRQTNILYRQAIDRNKELYDLLVDNRKRKEEYRNKIAELRVKKKKLLGLEMGSV